MFILRTAPQLLDLAASAVGPEVLAHPQFALRAHLPRTTPSIIPWHQDLACASARCSLALASPLVRSTLGHSRHTRYMNVWAAFDVGAMLPVEILCVTDLQPETCSTLIFNAWVPLVDADVANGCLAVQRYSHTQGLLPHETSTEVQAVGGKGSRGLRAESTPAEEAPDVVAVEMRVGDVLLLMEGTVHRSLPNTSPDRVRWSVDTRYNAAGEPNGRPHVPGFLARSATRPGAVAKSAEEWQAIVTGGQEGATIRARI